MIKKIFLLLFCLTIVSCASKKDILYYQNLKDGTQEYINYLPSSIQINDILYIKISALIPESAEPFNMQIGANATNINIETYRIQGYLVSQEGSIVFPILGTLKLAGKTTTEAQSMIAKMLNDGGYIKDPTVSVRVINSKITVLGEVKNPGTYSYDEQNLSLNQAIGLAGDLTINGVRNDVMIIREVNGVRTYANIDLTSSDWFSSPYYYVKQNDIIIVNPNGPRVKAAGYINGLGSALGIISFGLTLYLLLKK
ncbi:polysaccharide export protein [Flavobacterium sp. AS60]|uniref:polysaccharide biosynthesis/export family protein n=1 Tax=Flavobacterium anseongense TaxID=2910677 RepID=UPI001F1E9388|nr:polysaccharide biosynthesis/export family protein [Flavobacterium sp. AS60]MCF6129908.1 polysaccharide export protein [Flavobacterium sp. AS60]